MEAVSVFPRKPSIDTPAHVSDPLFSATDLGDLGPGSNVKGEQRVPATKVHSEDRYGLVLTSSWITTAASL